MLFADWPCLDFGSTLLKANLYLQKCTLLGAGRMFELYARTMQKKLFFFPSITMNSSTAAANTIQVVAVRGWGFRRSSSYCVWNTLSSTAVQRMTHTYETQKVYTWVQGSTNKRSAKDPPPPKKGTSYWYVESHPRRRTSSVETIWRIKRLCLWKYMLFFLHTQKLTLMWYMNRCAVVRTRRWCMCY